MKNVAIYARVSTDSQTVENQLQELHAVAQRNGWIVVAVHTDEGISGAKGRDKRPGYDALLTGVARKDYEMIACWSVDRLGRSLPHLVGFLGDIQAKGVDLYLHQQGLDTSTPSGRMLFQMLGVFAEFERAIITSRIKAAHDRCRVKGVRIGRPPMAVSRVEKVERALKGGHSIRAVAAATGVSTATVQRVKRSMQTVGEDRQETVQA